MKEAKKETAYQKWYRLHKADFAERRKKRYKKDADYRQSQLENARRYRRENPRPPTVEVPSEYEYNFGAAALAVGVDQSTLRDWMEKDYYPRPRQYGTAFYLTSDQVAWLIKIREFFDLHGSRRGARTEEFEQLKALLRANW